MKVEQFYPLLSLVGLILDIIGAFFLSIEAIGINKILDWKVKIFDIPSKLLKTRKTRDMVEMSEAEGYLKFPILFVSILSGLGAGLGTALGLFIDKLFLSSKHTIVAGSLGLVLSFVLTFFIPDFLAFLLSKVSQMLKWTEINFKNGQIGMLGFTFLFFGFLLQFLGTLLQWINNLKINM